MLIQRCISAIFLITSLILVVIFSKDPVGVFFSFIVANLIVAFGVLEFLYMMKKKGIRTSRLYGTVFSVLLTSAMFVYSMRPGLSMELEYLTIFILMTGLFLLQADRSHDSSALTNIATTLTGTFYVAWLFSFFLKINYFGGIDGRWYVFFVIVVVKGSDIMAYIIGTFWGRHKLVPTISPKKTVEGSLGGLLGGVIGAFISQLSFSHCELGIGDILFLGIALSLFGQIGDLAESILKRDAEVKDSGGYFPGIGGILDIIDSLLFSAPIMYFYMKFVLFG